MLTIQNTDKFRMSKDLTIYKTPVEGHGLQAGQQEEPEMNSANQR